MARKILEQPAINDPSAILDTLIPQYAENKRELDDYKKICDKENAEIKQLMTASNLTEKEAGGYIVKKIVQKRESMNEEILLQIAHNYGIPEIIKIREYVDFDVLENAIYNGKISEDVLLEMDKAKEVKEIVTLRISKKTRKGEEN